jgi:hypothetical protein
MIDPNTCHVQGARIITPKGDVLLLSAPKEAAPETFKAAVQFEGRRFIAQIPAPLALAWHMAGGHIHQEIP